MADPIRSAIPTPEQIAAMAAGFDRIGTAAQLVAAGQFKAFEAALPARPWARPLEVARRGPTIGCKRRARGRKRDV
jgi:hypothetical protein